MTPDPVAVPDGWQAVRLGDVAEVVRGLSWTREQESSAPVAGAVPVVRIGNVQRDGFHMDDVLHVRGVAESERLRRAISPRTLVMVGSNGNRDRVGNVFLSDRRVEGHLLASFLIAVEPSEDVSERFLAAVLRAAPTQSLITASTAGSTGLKNLSLKWLRSLRVELPPLPEQRAIAAVLDAIDEAIERTEEVIAATERLRDALLHELLTRGLPGRHSDWADVPGLGTVPACWDVVRLGEVTTDMVYGPRFPAGRYATDGGVVTLRTTDISDSGVIDWSQAPAADLEIERFAQFLLRRGDIVVTRSGSCGIAAIFRSHQKPVLPGAFLIRMRAARVEPEWVQLCLNSSIGRAQTLRAQAGGVQKNLNGPSLRSVLLPKPPAGERQEILRVLSSVAETAVTTAEEARSLLNEKEALAEALMTGRVRVPL